MEKSRSRRTEGLFVIEGLRELEAALQSGFSMHTLFLCPEIFRNAEKASALKQQALQTEEVTAAVYEKTAYRGTTEGVLALMHRKLLSVDALQVPEEPLILVLNLWKAGNRRCLRTADAAGVHAVFVDPLTDSNPNIIRASVLTVPTLPALKRRMAFGQQRTPDSGYGTGTYSL